MIQEIPDKVCKKCGGTTWEISSTSTCCRACRQAKSKLKWASREKIPRKHRKSEITSCSKCGSTDMYTYIRKTLRLDGTPHTTKYCIPCKRRTTRATYERDKNIPEKIDRRNLRQRQNYANNPKRRALIKSLGAKHRKAFPELYKKYNKDKYYRDIQDPVKKAKILQRHREFEQQGIETISDSYIRRCLRKKGIISEKKLRTIITPEQYEEYRQSLLIHRKFKSFKT